MTLLEINTEKVTSFLKIMMKEGHPILQHSDHRENTTSCSNSFLKKENHHECHNGKKSSLHYLRTLKHIPTIGIMG